MTREFMESGQSVPVTVIKVEKGRVLDVITKEKEGITPSKSVSLNPKIQNLQNKWKVILQEKYWT